MKLPAIDFGKCIYDTFEGVGVLVKSYGEVSQDNFDNYITEIKNLGFELSNTGILHNNTFHTLVKENNAVYLAYYPDIQEMRAIYEENSLYLSYENKPYNKITTTTVTQVDLVDFGLSYVVRLCDGRFVIFDGGWDFEKDADSLMKVLREQSVTDEIRIAAWIMTHPHIDHYRCFFPFMDKYRNDVKVEYMMYSFPEPDEEMSKILPAWERNDEGIFVDKFNTLVKELNIPVIRPHTGQVYDFANARFEVLSSLDDTFFLPTTDMNPFSLAMKMTAEDQVVLWTGDMYFENSKFAERWGEYLKSNIVQLPHHGFCGGREKEYELIDAKVCLAPVFERDAFETIDINYSFNRHLLFLTNLQEFITGGPGGYGTYTIELPYCPEEGAREKLLERINVHQEKMGKKLWSLMNLDTSAATLDISSGTVLNANIELMIVYADKKTKIKPITVDAFTTSEVSIDEFRTTPDELISIYVNSNAPVTVEVK